MIRVFYLYLALRWTILLFLSLFPIWISPNRMDDKTFKKSQEFLKSSSIESLGKFFVPSQTIWVLCFYLRKTFGCSSLKSFWPEFGRNIATHFCRPEFKMKAFVCYAGQSNLSCNYLLKTKYLWLNSSSFFYDFSSNSSSIFMISLEN